MSDEFARLFHEDQADRAESHAAMDWAEISARDAARLQRVEELLAAGAAQTPADYFHAAMIFQHGTELAHYWRAYELAKYAADHGYQGARWLTAAAYDRWLMQQQWPQKYGTQYIGDHKGWRLYEVDPATTDAERAEWNVPSLAQAQQRANAMNATDPSIPSTSPLFTTTLPGLRIELFEIPEVPPIPSPELLPPDIPVSELPRYLPISLTPYKMANGYCATTLEGRPVIFWAGLPLGDGTISIGWIQNGANEPRVEQLEIAHQAAAIISGQPNQMTYIVVTRSPTECLMVCGYLPQDELVRVTESLSPASHIKTGASDV